MNKITLMQINFASKITEEKYKKTSQILNKIAKNTILNNFNYENEKQKVLFCKCKIIIKLYELYNFINLDYIVDDNELKYYFPNGLIEI